MRNGPGLLALLGFVMCGSTAFGMGPFQKNADEVAAGMSAYSKGHWKEALEHFEAAKKKHPDRPEVDLDRGNALYQLKRYDDAKAAYAEALKAAPGKLSEKSYYDLGNAWARMKKRKEAVTAFRHALELDPHDEQARHNLEVMLRRIPPKKRKKSQGSPRQSDAGTDGGQPKQDGGSNPRQGRDGGTGSDGGTDGGTHQGAGQGDGGTDAGTRSRNPRRNQRDAGSGQNAKDKKPSSGQDAGTDGGTERANPQPSEMEDGGSSMQPKHMSKQDAERLLNAMKQNEKSLQLWRFQEKGKHPRRAHEKDW